MLTFQFSRMQGENKRHCYCTPNMLTVWGTSRPGRERLKTSYAKLVIYYLRSTICKMAMKTCMQILSVCVPHLLSMWNFQVWEDSCFLSLFFFLNKLLLHQCWSFLWNFFLLRVLGKLGSSLPGACFNPRWAPDGRARVCIFVAMLWLCFCVWGEVLFFVVFYCDKHAEQGRIVVEGMSGWKGMARPLPIHFRMTHNFVPQQKRALLLIQSLQNVLYLLGLLDVFMQVF